MPRLLAMPTCIATACLALSACTAPAAPTPASTSPAIASIDRDAELLARGDYLVRISGCNDCHTPAYGERGGNVPRDQWLVGSPVGFSGPWGTIYAANLRIKAAEMDEAGWLDHTAKLHTRPIMPDFALRAMTEDDRRALYRLVRSLGPVADKAPDYLPPGKTPPAPYLQLVLPPAPPAATAAPVAAG